MKKLLIFLMLSATAANALACPSTDNERTVRFSGSLEGFPADHRESAGPPGVVPAVIAADHNRLFAAGPGSSTNEAVAPQTDELKERMMGDKGIMSLISAMQNDPAMQALLSDPAIMSAVQSGDIGTLLDSPAFMKLLDNPRVREIEKSLETGETR